MPSPRCTMLNGRFFRTVVRTLSILLPASAAFGQPANNNCANAPTVGVGNVSGTTVNATNDGSANCATSFDPDVWYRFVPAANGQLIVQTCGGATWDTVLSIHSGCPGTTANQLSCNDDACGNAQSRTAAVVNAGVPYWIRVSGFGGSTGPFTLSITLGPPPPPCTPGPDVSIYNLTDVANYGSIPNGTVTAFAVGTDACNLGCDPVEWVDSTPAHPVIAQNMFRLMNGRFEQIGQSWLKHAFASTNGDGCGICSQPPNGGQQLGAGCSDAYYSGLNGDQSGLGPRSLVNATTGQFPYPFSAPPYGTVIDRRLQVFTADVTPAQNPGALYFVDCQYITADDAAHNNGLNNASYCQISIPSASATPSFIGFTHPLDPAIRAWYDNDPSVTLVAADYSDAGITARFWVGAKATNNGNGTWHFEYAVYNLNSDRCGGTFSVPIGTGVTTSNVGFHAPFSHSGEPYSNAAWTSSVASGALTFTTQSYATNSNANAIRWGTLYNFRFDANGPPVTGSATLGLFKPGVPASLAIAGLPVPGSACPPAPNGDMNADGHTDGQDIQQFVTAVITGSTAATDVCRGDYSGNSAMNVADVAPFVSALLSS